MIQDHYLGGQNILLLFNSDILTFLFKTDGAETEGLIILFLEFGVL